MNQPTITQPLPTQSTRQFQIKIEEHASSNHPSIKRKFPSILPPINTDYMVETHYQAKSFLNSFELLKKVIIDLAGDKEENCEYDIIVKKRKITGTEVPKLQANPPISFEKVMGLNSKEEKPIALQRPSPSEKMTCEEKENDGVYEESEKENEEDNSTTDHLVKQEKNEFLSISAKHRHKNCPKLFGRAFFNLVLNNKEFQNKYLQKSEFCQKIPEIEYPKNSEVSLNDFFSWIKKERFNEKYTNLKVFRDIWSWRSDSNENAHEKHFKYYLSKLMKVFFEQYAYTYIIKSNIQPENGKDYINFIPKFLNGIDHPESFTSLKD